MFKALSTYALSKFNVEKLQKYLTENKKEINIWTDGSLTGKINYGVGIVMPTYNAIKNLTDIDDVMQYGFRLNLDMMPTYFKNYNNVVCELFAAMFSIQYIRNIQPDCRIMLNYDYSGVENWITGAWDAKKVDGIDLPVTKLYRAWFYYNELQYVVSFNHVKAHVYNSGNNDLADIAARNGHKILSVELLKDIDKKDDKTISRLVFTTDRLEVRCDWSNELVQ